MLGLRWRIDCQPRTKNGQPAHRTTGVASTSCVHANPAPSRCANEIAGIISPIAISRSGTANSAPIRNRRVMSINSGFGAFSAVTDMGSSPIPHSGQLSGPSRTISGCMGQVYWVPGAATGTGRSSGGSR